MHPFSKCLLVLGSSGVLLLQTAWGGEKEVVQPTAPLSAPSEVPLWSVDSTADYTIGSRFKWYSGIGSQAEYHYSLDAVRRVQIKDGWYFRFGTSLERFDFSRSNAALPYSLNSVAADIGIEYWSGPKLGFELQLTPGVYFTRDHITSNSFDIPVVLGVGIPVTPAFSLAVGIRTSILSQYPVLPGGGFVWDVNDRLKISALFPRPIATYKLSDHFSVFASGELLGGDYRNGPTNDRRTNNAVLEYTEYRAGAGIMYNVGKQVSASLGAGWTFERDFDYFHSGPQFRTRGAPYAQFKLTLNL